MIHAARASQRRLRISAGPACHTAGVRVVLAAVAALAIVATATLARAEVVRDIVVEDNTRTTPDTVSLISKLEVGDEWTPDMTAILRERLVSSGLFKDVEVYWEPMEGGIRVHILVKDKFPWIVAPAFYTQPTNIGGGFGYGQNNLFGLNQKLLIYAQIATGDTFFISVWQVPSIGGTRLHSELDTYLANSRNIEYASPRSYIDNPQPVRDSRLIYLNAAGKLGVELYRGIKLDGRLRGAHVSYREIHLAKDAHPADVLGPDAPSDATIPAPGREGWDVSGEVDATVDRRTNWYGIAGGYRFGVAYEQALPVLGSDFHYREVGADAYDAIRFFDRHNLVLKAHLNIGHHLPFQQEYVMGGTSMRGWLNNQFRGDFKALANIEYSVPVFTVKGLSVRGLAFLDSGYTTFLTTSNPERNYLPDAAARGLSPFKNSVGVGTRLYLRQIVLPLLGLDFGYGLEAGDFQVYLAIGLTD